MPHAGEPADTTLVDIKVKFVLITPRKKSYDSDHAVLTDQQDWKRGTAKYADKDPFEWENNKHRFPISQTKNTPLKITVVFYVSRKTTETVSGKVVGDGGAPCLRFEGSGSFAPGQDVTVTGMTAAAPLPDQVCYLANLAITWRVEGGGEIYPVRSSGPSSVYVTMDVPKDEGADEDGPTHRRMNTAVRLVETVRSNDPHTIVANLMSRFQGYTLQRNPRVPREHNHPTYFNGVGGAWPLYENMSAGAECQAIVRFVKGVIHQVGCPGKAEAVVVHANPFNGNAVENAFGHAGMSSHGWFQHNGKQVFATLVDQVVEEGRSYPPSHTPVPGGGGSPGFNNYEACLKFTHGATKYYAGGVGIFNSKEEVIRVFTALVWASPAPSIPGGYYIDKVVRRYR